jgi:lysozyme
MLSWLLWVLFAWVGDYQFSAAQYIAQAPDASPHRHFPTITDHIFDESRVESFGISLGAAPSSPPRSILRAGIILIKYFEHWVPQPYNDPAGYCTIGYGHLISSRRCEDVDPLLFADGITGQQGDTLLSEDTVYSRRAVQSLVHIHLSDEQFSALASHLFLILEGISFQSLRSSAI